MHKEEFLQDEKLQMAARSNFEKNLALKTDCYLILSCYIFWLHDNNTVARTNLRSIKVFYNNMDCSTNYSGFHCYLFRKRIIDLESSIN